MDEEVLGLPQGAGSSRTGEGGRGWNAVMFMTKGCVCK